MREDVVPQMDIVKMLSKNQTDTEVVSCRSSTSEILSKSKVEMDLAG